MPARAVQATAKPTPAASVMPTSPSATEQPPLPPLAEPCPPAAALLPASSSTGVQQASPSTSPDLMIVWRAASSAERSAFLRQLVANLPLAEHTGAWAAISGKILVAFETNMPAVATAGEPAASQENP